MKHAELTDFYPARILPYWYGVYEVFPELPSNSPWYAYWDGKKFCYRDKTVDEAFETTMQMIEQQLTAKGAGVGAFILNIGAEITAMKEVEKRIATRRKSLETKQEWLKEYLKTNMQKCGITEIKADDLSFVIKLGAFDRSLVVDSVDLIPEEYVTTETIITKKVDKNQLKKLISEGATIEGVHIEENQRITIK